MYPVAFKYQSGTVHTAQSHRKENVHHVRMNWNSQGIPATRQVLKTRSKAGMGFSSSYHQPYLHYFLFELISINKVKLN